MILALHIALILILIYRWKWLMVDGSRPWISVVVLAMKVTLGWWLTGYYMTAYGGGDMHDFLKDAGRLAELFYKDTSGFFGVITGLPASGAQVSETIESMRFWVEKGVNLHYNDARTVIRFHALLGLFSGGQALVHLLWSNVVALAGSLTLLRFFSETDSPGKSLPLSSLIVLFLPGSLIWSSMVLKEPLLLLAMGVTLRYFRICIINHQREGIPYLIAGILLFLLVKSFWLLALVPGLAAWLLFRKSLRPAPVVYIAYTLAVLALVSVAAFYPAFDIPSLLYGQQLESWRFAVYRNAGSLFHPVPFAPDTFSLLKHLPQALAYSLFRPWPSEWIRFGNIPFIIENAVLVFLFIVAVISCRRRRISLGFPVMVAVMGAFVILAVCGFTGSVTGNLVRYRLPGILLLSGALWSLASGTSLSGRQSSAESK